MISKIKNHRLKSGDVMDGIDDLMDGEVADFIYSDPPWGQGNIKYWQTINKRHTGKEPRSILYTEFLDKFFKIVARYTKDVAVIEYGVSWREDIIKYAESSGFVHGGCCVSMYKAGKMLPLDIHLISKSGKYKVTKQFADGCLENTGFKVVDFVFNEILPEDASVVLDPMCGLGYTAQATVDRGLSFRGNELNPKRLEKTMARLK